MIKDLESACQLKGLRSNINLSGAGYAAGCWPKLCSSSGAKTAWNEIENSITIRHFKWNVHDSVLLNSKQEEASCDYRSGYNNLSPSFIVRPKFAYSRKKVFGRGPDVNPTYAFARVLSNNTAAPYYNHHQDAWELDPDGNPLPGVIKVDYNVAGKYSFNYSTECQDPGRQSWSCPLRWSNAKMYINFFYKPVYQLLISGSWSSDIACGSDPDTEFLLFSSMAEIQGVVSDLGAGSAPLRVPTLCLNQPLY